MRRHVFIALAVAVAVSSSAAADVWHEVLGAKPGQPGAALAGVTFGVAEGKALPKGWKARVAAFAKKYGVTLGDGVDTDGNGAVVEVGATFPKPGVHDQLAAIWGAPNDASGAWVDHDAHTCARAVTAKAGDDRVSFIACRTLDELVAPDRADRLGVEPYPLLGTSLAKLRAQLGAALVKMPTAPDGGDAQWDLDGPGLPDGGSAELQVVAKGDTIVLVDLALEGAASDADAMNAALTKKLGVAAVADPTADAGAWTWTAHGVVVREEVSLAMHGANELDVSVAPAAK